MQQLDIKITLAPETEEDANLIATWDRDTDVFLYNGEIMPDLGRVFSDFVSTHKKGSKALLFMVTPGGSADDAFRIGRLFQKSYDRFTLGIPAECKSAGTLLALGASQIAMGPLGELGPLDVQVLRPDEIVQRSSGLVMSQALEFLESRAFASWEQIFLNIKKRSMGVITTQTASDIALSLTSSIYSPIAERIDPMHLGDMQRSVDIAYHYGVRLGAQPHIVRHLIEGYPTHGFVIDMREAKQLFDDVREFEPFEHILLNCACDVLKGKFERDIVNCFDPTEDYFIHIELSFNNKDEDDNQDHGTPRTEAQQPPAGGSGTTRKAGKKAPKKVASESKDAPPKK